MANRLTQKRRKCVKSPNIFRDKQEYSSLYTISSRSTSSVQSLEMASQISKQNSNQSRIYKGQHHKGDSANTPSSGKLPSYGKYPKLPNEISQELQQKFYSNSHKSYYNDRSQFIKNKFDKLTLENNPRSVENKQPFPKPHCPMHIGAPPNNHYVINRLEESYWAKWKPSKCDEMDSWRNYLDQAGCNRRPHCTTTRMLPEDCLNMLVQSKKRHRNRCCEEKLVKVIRGPSELQDSNSSDVCISKKVVEKKSKCSCCTCPQDDSDEEKSVRFKLKKKEGSCKKYCRKRNEQSDEENLETSQEEYEHLYNEMYQEYEADLMNRISEYEMQKEEEEMREMEKQLAEQEKKKRTEEKPDRELIPNHISENNDNVVNENFCNMPCCDANENQHKYNKQEKRIRNSCNNNTMQDDTNCITKDNYQNFTQEGDQSMHFDDAEHKRFRNENNSTEQGNRHGMSQDIPRSTGPDELQSSRDQKDQHTSEQTQKAAQKQEQKSPKEESQKNPAEQNYPLQQVHPEERPQSQSSRGTSRNSPVESKQNSPRNNEKQGQEGAEKQGQEKAEKQGQEKPEKDTARTLDEWEDYQKMDRLLKNVPDKELTPHFSPSTEYSEPEIAILKHTDSFIINSRRQKEDRPRKPQPKFIKLTKPTFSPIMKGHTYPLKPALKKEKPPSQPILGFSRPQSANTPKARNSSKQFLPAYLSRH